MRSKIKQNKFQRIKKFKDNGKTVVETTRKLKIKENTVKSAFRAINMGFSTIGEYNNHYARKKGFRDMSQYVQVQKIINSDGDGSRRFKQREFEKSIELVPPETIPDIPLEEYLPKKIEQQYNLLDSIQKLPDRLRKILNSRFYDYKTLRETGKLFGISYQRIEQLEAKAISYLEMILNGKSPPKDYKRNKVEDGEILLIHILSKSFNDQDTSGRNYGRPRKIRDFINQFYHEQEDYRSTKSIYQILNNPPYKRRLKKIKENFLPLNL